MYLIRTKILPSPIEGKGYFADENIPKGTLVYCFGEKDARYSRDTFEKLEEKEKGMLGEFGIEDEFGNWVETNTGPYTNHSCDPSIMPLFIQGNYVDIAVKDIKIGDEITIDYAQLFSSTNWKMKCTCGTKLCRKTIGFGLKTDAKLEQFWEARIVSALTNLNKVPQPIFQSKDKYAIEITKFLKSLQKPAIGKYVKFSLIESNIS